MARPIKKGLDYFTHDVACSNERAIRYIESKYGLIGYAIYFKILEKIYGEEGYFIHWKPVDECIYSAEWGVDVEFIRNLLSDFFEIGLFTKWIYEANQVLTSSGIQARYHEAAKKRPKYEGIASFCVINAAPSGIDSAETQPEEEKEEVNSAESAQRKGKESKEEKKIKPSIGMFDQFWKAYPRKIGKGAAETAWKKIKEPGATLVLILEAIERQKESQDWQKENGQYIPNPATWLNQRRWEDEVSNQPARPPQRKGAVQYERPKPASDEGTQYEKFWKN